MSVKCNDSLGSEREFGESLGSKGEVIESLGSEGELSESLIPIPIPTRYRY